jgi:hypothetical protein
MSQESVEASAKLGPEEKRAALEAVLQSETFPHSGQLRTMLIYVCEREITGRASDISEYTIGIDVLHRSEGYSVAADSSVRKRAYELRQKLHQVYASELSGVRVRIEIPKGSYVPRFNASEPSLQPVAESRPQIASSKPAASRRQSWLLGFVGVGLAAVGFAAAWFLRPIVAETRPESILVVAWGPMARSGADALVCIATNLHLIVRPHVENAEGRVYSAFPELYEAFRNHRPLTPGTKLSMIVADNSVTFGEVWAVALASAQLQAFGVSHQTLPESAVPLLALRNRNAVVVGVPADSQVVSNLLARTPYTLAFPDEAQDQAVLDRRGAGSPKVPFSTQNGYTYGLLTVVPSEGAPAGQKQTVIFSGTGSAPVQAAAEFFCSPSHLTEFKMRLKREGYPRFPAAYQVVVRCRTSKGLLVSWDYVTHVVISR